MKMHVVHGKDVLPTFEGARMLEQKAELKAAMEIYEKLLKAIPQKLKVITRLLILYRKLKYYKKELTLINAAIKIHEQRYDHGKTVDKKISMISKKLNLLLGHIDKKGKPILVSGEILKLQQRKATLIKKMG